MHYFHKHNIAYYHHSLHIFGQYKNLLYKLKNYKITVLINPLLPLTLHHEHEYQNIAPPRPSPQTPQNHRPTSTDLALDHALHASPDPIDSSIGHIEEPSWNAIYDQDLHSLEENAASEDVQEEFSQKLTEDEVPNSRV